MTLQKSSFWHVISFKIVINVKKIFIFSNWEFFSLFWVFQWIIMAFVQDPNSLRSLRVDPMWTRPHQKNLKNLKKFVAENRGLKLRHKVQCQNKRSCPVQNSAIFVIFDRHFFGSWFIPIYRVGTCSKIRKMSKIFGIFPTCSKIPEPKSRLEKSVFQGPYENL